VRRYAWISRRFGSCSGTQHHEWTTGERLGPRALAHLAVDEQGFGWLPEADFVGHFAGDLDPPQARVLYAVQQPISMSTFEYTMGEPAWKSLPSWFVVAANDEAIPPDAERHFAERMGATIVEVDAGHLAMVTHPDTVVDLIEAAARATVGAAS
jgi:pimeloyl-ACP methyl ester carboxylesterase